MNKEDKDKFHEWLLINKEVISEEEAMDEYDNFLDEVYPDCKIANLEYSTSYALKEIDPTAYRCGFNDWADSEYVECCEGYILKDDYKDYEDEYEDKDKGEDE